MKKANNSQLHHFDDRAALSLFETVEAPFRDGWGQFVGFFFLTAAGMRS